MALVVPTNKQPYKIQPEEINFSFAIGFQLEHKYSYWKHLIPWHMTDLIGISILSKNNFEKNCIYSLFLQTYQKTL